MEVASALVVVVKMILSYGKRRCAEGQKEQKINNAAASSGVSVMPAKAGIQFLVSGFRRNDDASVGVLNPAENKYRTVGILQNDEMIRMR